MGDNPFHSCATCMHYVVEKIDKKIYYRCSRLGYETNPKFKFNCWTPKEQVAQLMKKRGYELERG